MKSLKAKVPSSLDEITLEAYQEYEQIKEPTNKDLIRIFLGLPQSVIDKLPYKEVERVVQIVGQMFNEEQRLQATFKMDGVEYGFIPDLDGMTTGEYNDLVKYSSDIQKMERFMAVLYRPITHKKKGKYLIEDYEGSAKYMEVMKQAPLSVVMGAMVFFLNLANELLIAIPSYLRTEAEKQMGSLKNGEPITNYLHSLEKDLKWLRMPLGQTYTKP